MLPNFDLPPSAETHQAPARALFAKAEEYFEAGCLEVWLVYPEARLILAKQAGQDWRLVLPGQEIATGEVLSGFAIAIEQLLA